MALTFGFGKGDWSQWLYQASPTHGSCCGSSCTWAGAGCRTLPRSLRNQQENSTTLVRTQQELNDIAPSGGLNLASPLADSSTFAQKKEEEEKKLCIQKLINLPFQIQGWKPYQAELQPLHSSLCFSLPTNLERSFVFLFSSTTPIGVFRISKSLETQVCVIFYNYSTVLLDSC